LARLPNELKLSAEIEKTEVEEHSHIVNFIVNFVLLIFWCFYSVLSIHCAVSLLYLL